jgi:hypothetical protein
MRLASPCHTEMAGEAIVFQVVLSCATESVLVRSPSDTSRVEVVGELATEFEKVEDWRSWLEWPAARIYDLLLRPPLGRDRLVDRLDEATGQLRVKLVAQ